MEDFISTFTRLHTRHSFLLWTQGWTTAELSWSLEELQSSGGTPIPRQCTTQRGDKDSPLSPRAGGRGWTDRLQLLHTSKHHLYFQVFHCVPLILDTFVTRQSVLLLKVRVWYKTAPLAVFTVLLLFLLKCVPGNFTLHVDGMEEHQAQQMKMPTRA